MNMSIDQYSCVWNYTQKRSALLWPPESLIWLIAPVRTLHLHFSLCICDYFFKEMYGFYYSLIFPSFKALLGFFSFNSNGALTWCHKYTLFSHNCLDHVRIRVLLNVFSVKFINLKHIFCCLFFYQKKRFAVIL